MKQNIKREAVRFIETKEKTVRFAQITFLVNKSGMKFTMIIWLHVI